MRFFCYAVLISNFFITNVNAELRINFSGVAKQTFKEEVASTTYELPVGPFSNGSVKTLPVKGKVLKKAWHIKSPSETVTSLRDSVRAQLENEGFKLLYECETQICGGFDFRFHTEILPDPKMHVDLGNYKFFSAQRQTEKHTEFLSCIVSRGGNSLFLQLFLVNNKVFPDLDLKSSNKVGEAVTGSLKYSKKTIHELLDEFGSAVLSDVEFKAGSSDLDDKDYLSLIDLAKYLDINKKFKVVLVGHTDAEGDLDKNVKLSEDRAESVAGRLISQFNIRKDRVSFEGIGFLSPRASNLNAEGRNNNRRVEVIILK
ncbi:MAG: OmpA family protein [Paracoccaceae bacterium]